MSRAVKNDSWATHTIDKMLEFAWSRGNGIEMPEVIDEVNTVSLGWYVCATVDDADYHNTTAAFRAATNGSVDFPYNFNDNTSDALTFNVKKVGLYFIKFSGIGASFRGDTDRKPISIIKAIVLARKDIAEKLRESGIFVTRSMADYRPKNMLN